MEGGACIVDYLTRVKSIAGSSGPGLNFQHAGSFALQEAFEA